MEQGPVILVTMELPGLQKPLSQNKVGKLLIMAPNTQ